MSEDGLGTDPPTVAAHTGRQSPAQKGPNQYAAFRHRDFRLFVAMRTLSNMAQLIQSVAVGWQVYDITRRPLDLGLVGLVLFLPQILLALPAGQAADRFPRKYLIITMLGLNVVASTLLLALTAMGNQDIGMILAILFLFGAGRTFVGPATMAILPAVVSRAELPNAITWNSSTWQAAVVMGPALGGLLYGFGAVVVYGAVVGLLMVALAAAAALRPAPQSPPGGSRGLRDLLAGVRFVRDHPILLGAISLDLFAVLFGGATALLPVFARDILSVGPVGLGLLRSAPAVGSVACALWLAGRPLRQRAGRSMFLCVAGFGLATIAFGLSTNFYFSLAALAVSGACDMVSVYVRQTVIQLGTPDAMRGRVNAVSLVFIGASNELGEFESGVTAAWFGTVPSVVLGGIGTVVVVALWSWRFAALRRVDRLDQIYANARP
jgi:MFS family permease